MPRLSSPDILSLVGVTPDTRRIKRVLIDAIGRFHVLRVKSTREEVQVETEREQSNSGNNPLDK